MNKIMIALSLLCALAAQGQILNVESVERVTTSDNDKTVMQAVAISPQG